MRVMRVLDFIFLGLWLFGLAYVAVDISPLPADAEMIVWIATVVFGAYISISFFIKRYLISREYKDQFDI